MKEMNSEQVYQMMLDAVEKINARAARFNWEDEGTYANWMAQSFYYVSWTTRQLALASAKTKPGTEDSLHWRFIEEAGEEKKHELLVLKDLKNFGYSIEQFPELPHSAFFYQSLNYMIEREHPIAILGFSLTLEGFAALKAKEFYPRVRKAHGETTSNFLKVHCEVDVDHFANALPHLRACPAHLLPIIARGIELCTSIYIGILDDITEYQATHAAAGLAAKADAQA